MSQILSKIRPVIVPIYMTTDKKMTPADISRAQRLARDWTAAFEKRKKK